MLMFSMSHRNSAVDASLYDESFSPSARSSNTQHLHIHLMEKLNLSDNGSKRKRGKKKESPSGSHGLPDDFDDNKSATSARSKVSSLQKSKSITKKKA